MTELVALVDDEGGRISPVVHLAIVTEYASCPKRQERCRQDCEGYRCYRLLCGTKGQDPWYVETFTTVEFEDGFRRGELRA